MGKLVGSIRLAGRRTNKEISGSSFTSGAEVELAGVINDGVQITVTVSTIIFERISMSLGRRKASWRGPWRLRKKIVGDENEKKSTEVAVIGELNRAGEEMSLRGLKKKKEEELKMAVRRMQESEKCLSDVNDQTEKLYRSLIAARVSLLNTLTR